jgi:signal transduction histidine kinase
VMHGSVRVEATEGGGATFVVELPMAPALQAVD